MPPGLGHVTQDRSAGAGPGVRKGGGGSGGPAFIEASRVESSDVQLPIVDRTLNSGHRTVLMKLRSATVLQVGVLCASASYGLKQTVTSLRIIFNFRLVFR